MALTRVAIVQCNLCSLFRAYEHVWNSNNVAVKQKFLPVWKGSLGISLTIAIHPKCTVGWFITELQGSCLFALLHIESPKTPNQICNKIWKVNNLDTLCDLFRHLNKQCTHRLHKLIHWWDMWLNTVAFWRIQAHAMAVSCSLLSHFSRRRFSEIIQLVSLKGCALQ